MLFLRCMLACLAMARAGLQDVAATKDDTAAQDSREREGRTEWQREQEREEKERGGGGVDVHPQGRCTALAHTSAIAPGIPHDGLFFYNFRHFFFTPKKRGFPD